jgi:hydroxypyruvate isomerase
MPTFSANLGFLWNDLPAPLAVRAAADAGFAAVEFHWPYETGASELQKALGDNRVEVVSVNTARGSDDGFGLAALPGREGDARASIDQAVEYASEIGASNVHVMAGISKGHRSESVFDANLIYACERAAHSGVTILIEPLNPRDAPSYHLGSTAQAEAIIERLDQPNLKMMFDCYHVEILDGDVGSCLERLLPIIGHIQFASVPDRSEPDRGNLDYREIFALIDDLGWREPIGAEYRPSGLTVESGLGWMASLV